MQRGSNCVAILLQLKVDKDKEVYFRVIILYALGPLVNFLPKSLLRQFVSDECSTPSLYGARLPLAALTFGNHDV